MMPSGDMNPFLNSFCLGWRSLGEISYNGTLIIGLGFTASRAGFFNVGLVAGLAGWIMLVGCTSFPNLPRPLMLLATVVIAAAAGGVIGAYSRNFMYAYL